MSDIRTPADAIGRLCALQREIADKVLGYDQPNDCFCRDPQYGGFNGGEEYFRHSGQTIEFIEEAVREKIARATGGHTNAH